VWRIVFRCHRTGDEYIVVLTIQLEFEIRIRHGFLTQRVLRVPRILLPFLFKEERNARPSRRAATCCGLASATGSRTTAASATTAAATATRTCCEYMLTATSKQTTITAKTVKLRRCIDPPLFN
jgi:hypothetical protein